MRKFLTIPQIEQFFEIIDAELSQDVQAILIGAAAGNIMGSKRASIDIDFAVELSKPGEANWQQLESASKKAMNRTGIVANYAEDIDRCGMVTLLDYKNKTKLYKKYGKLALMVLEPAYWSIGKMTRFLEPDISDMKSVFIKKKVSPAYLAEVWGKALKESPRSTTLIRFRRQVEYFFESYGTKIWGRNFNSSKAIKQFHHSAGIVN